MIRFSLIAVFIIWIFIVTPSASRAHVPFLENTDFSESEPFLIDPPIQKSRAVYGWLDSCNDIDVYTFEITEQSHLRAFSLVPVCPDYEDFLPSFAVVGPGLTTTANHLPFKVRAGYGAVVVNNNPPGKIRNTFFEPFTNKNYYRGQSFDQTVSTPGTWYVYYWDPTGRGGDYVAVFGFTEQFSFRDILRALINTPKIWFDRELHTNCP